MHRLVRPSATNAARKHQPAPQIASRLLIGAITLAVFASLYLFIGSSAPDVPSPSPIVAALSQSPLRTTAQVHEAYGQIPLSFEANRGQADESVNYMARGAGYTLSLSPTTAVFALARKSSERSPGDEPSQSSRDNRGAAIRARRDSDTPDSTRSEPPMVLRMNLVGANRGAAVEGLNELEGKVNYFTGNDPSRWLANIPTFGRVRYTEVYTGIDVVYYGNQKQLEYDFVVAPGSDARAITLRFEGADKVEVDATGDLLLTLGESVIRQPKPYVYQQVGGERHAVEGGYFVESDGRVGFTLGQYDTNAPLVIDPVLVYSTYLGGSGADEARGIVVDSSGNAYICGETASTNFPTASPIQATFGGGTIARDAFVTKLNAAGTALVYSTYLGGSGDASHNGDDRCFGLAVDSAGNAYVAGETHSQNFPTANAFQGTFGGGFADGFVTKLNAAGNALVYSSYLGGTIFDAVGGIALDSSNNVYITGRTTSSDFPTVNPIQASYSGEPGADAFVTKLNAAGNALVYSTYLGGNDGEGFENGSSIAVDSAGNAYVTGQTSSTNFPTANAIQATFGGGTPDGDAFVTKLNAAGNAFVYSTYLGSSDNDVGQDIAVDSSGNAHVAGSTFSSDFPTANAFDSTFGGTQDGFVTKLNAAGNAFIYSTYLGGSGGDATNGIALDSSGNTYVAGGTSSTDLPTVKSSQSIFGGGSGDAFVAKLNAAGTALDFSTYLGGSGFDRGNAIAVDSAGSIYVAGITTSSNFPTLTPVQGTNGGNNDAFVTKLAPVSLSFDPDGSNNPNGTGSLPAVPVKDFDFAVGNALADNSMPLSVGNTFQLYYQARLSALIAPSGTSSTPTGLNTTFEITVVASLTETVMSIAPGGAPATFQLAPVQAANSFIQFYYDGTPDSNDLAGTGFSDGTLILVGFPDGRVPNSGSFTVTAPGGTPTLAPYDQFGANNYPGVQTVQGSGSSTMGGTITSVDPAFFQTSGLRAISFAATLSLPFNAANPSALFYNGATTFPPNIGPINGHTAGGGTDFQLQTDASASIILAAVNLTKLTNGTDNNTAPGIFVPVGSTVTFSYVVTNPGDEPLSGVTVKDNNGTPGTLADDFNATFVGGDTNSNGLLDSTETWAFTASRIATSGQYTNIGTVTGTGAVFGGTVTDTDGDNHFGGVAAINLVKLTNGTNNNSTPGIFVPIGSTVTFTYVVTNNGDVPLSGVTVTDDNGTPGTLADDFNATFVGGDNGNGLLDTTETWTFTASRIATPGQYTNIGTATGTPPGGGSPVNDTDVDNHFGSAPGINLVKLTNGTDNNSTPGPSVPIGSTVTFTYVVTNTGNVPLSGVTVKDDNGTSGNLVDDFNPTFLSGDTNTNGLLDTTETWTFTASRIATSGQYTNVGTATGTPPPGGGSPVSDTDADNHFGFTPNSTKLSSSSYSASEAAGHITITVIRAGDISGPASVDYETSDLSGLTNCDVVTGNASQRCDYTAIAGTLNFPAGDSLAAFDIPIINDVYVEGSETFTLTLSNPIGGGSLIAPSSATLTITDDDLAPGASNPSDGNTFFIRQQYLDILGREPDPPGLAGWLAFINNCPAGSTACDRIELSSRFFRSPEFFDRAYYIYRFYNTALGRKPTYDEYQKDLRKVAGFLTAAELEARKAAFAEEFSQRPEFKARYDSKADGDEYVNAIVATAGVLPSNRTSVSIRQGALVITRGQALRELLESPEISARFFNEAFVVVGYFAYLRREPDAQYLVFLNTLNTTGDYREMIRSFIESQEYRRRFGPN